MSNLIKLFFISSALFFSACNYDAKKESETAFTSTENNDFIGEPYESVNPFIGTGGHGHTYPGATLPFGMVQLSPDTRLEGWDGCSGYHYTDSVAYGFSHTHLSGTGVADYGDILLMPFQGELTFDNGYKTDNGYSSSFDKSTEKAYPGYYFANLTDHNIDVELTTTKRVGIHKYTYNNEDEVNQLILDLEHRDELVDWSLEKVSDTEIVGHRISKAWAEEQHLYFILKTSEPFRATYSNVNNGTTPKKAALSFCKGESKEVTIKVGISAVSIEGARKNLAEESSHWDFNQYVAEAKEIWTKELSKIEVSGGTKEQHEIFYSALYHTMIAPNVFNDVDGQFRGADIKVHQADNDVYTIFSLWDTFRATHPLYTIIDQKRTNDYINTFLLHYQYGGKLPVWELAGNYTGCMIGYHSVPVITDAYLKGIQNYDASLALKAMQHSATLNHLGLPAFIERGFIEAGDEPESVSKTLEYAYDDWCIAMLAQSLEDTATYDQFIQRAQYYKNIFNPENGFMQSKRNGGWSVGFNPTEVNFNFTEANSWQYSMFVPQDISGMIDLYGGADAFENKLDELFTTEAELSGRHQSDITGLIGQYAHGNEPSHHMAYLYNYIGKPWKTQERVHEIMQNLYTNQPDGLSGNEDCGQMSAWYILSAMGFYSVTPGVDYYAIGTPAFGEAKINLENGNQFVIKANNISATNKYIQSAQLNGEPYSSSYINHFDIMNGGELVFEMGPTPNKEWGNTSYPSTSIEKEDQIVPAPYFSYANGSFTDSINLEIKSVDPTSEIFYILGDNETKKYSAPILFDQSAKIVTWAEKDGKKSKVISSSYILVDGSRSIEVISEYDNQYNGGGENALIDYVRGGNNFKSGSWQGFYGKDFEAIVDLGSLQAVNKISLSALQDIKSWIWYPPTVKISVSEDGISFKELATIKNDFPEDSYGSFNQEYSKILNTPVQARYIKLEAANYGVCPSWHLGNGNDTWLFFDEITVE